MTAIEANASDLTCDVVVVGAGIVGRPRQNSWLQPG